MRLNRFRNGMDASQMKFLLDELASKYNNPSFIQGDPISIPHRYSDPLDIEISAFLSATIAWGRRDLIIRSATRLMTAMGNEPYKFIMEASVKETESLSGFVHRTFNDVDAISFIQCLRKIYSENTSMESLIAEGLRNGNGMYDAIINLRNNFFSSPHPSRTERHLSDISKGSAGKKINMFIRWMVRKDTGGVDFGLWENISPSELYIPLDLHAGNMARQLGLLTRRQNDWKAVEELTMILREFDPHDPVKYDFALFGLGVSGDFRNLPV